MGEKIHVCVDTYTSVITTLEDLGLNDIAGQVKEKIFNVEINNEREIWNNTINEFSDSDSLDTSNDDSSKLNANLKESNLDDTHDFHKNFINNNTNNELNKDNEKKSPESPMSDNSNCNSLDTTDDDSSREDNFHTKLQVVKEPLAINVRKATKFRDRPQIKHIGTYPMRSNPRGYVLIIANNLYKKEKDRPSAKHDEANLKRLFEDMGFKVLTHFDLTGEEIEKKIEEFSKMQELRRVDSAFVVVSSHGSGKLGQQETEILGVDYNTKGYKRVVCTKIMNYFTAENCRNLSGKPKVFIFQTCRGKYEQSAIPRHTVDAVTTPKAKNQDYLLSSETMRNYEDMLIVYSTLPGYVSYRDKLNGSWFIQILCEVFMNYAHKVHVQELFYMIDHRLKNIRTIDERCQTPSITSQGFNKYCFLNPGLFEDKNETSVATKTEVTFKCCPGRRANIQVCTHCESIYHQKCAQKLEDVKIVGNVKVNCCMPYRCNDDKDEFDNKSLSENVEELKKILDDLKEENVNLKEQICSIKTQNVSIMSNEISMKNCEYNLKFENLNNENELLKQLNQELKSSAELLKEKNEWLARKLEKNKKHRWIKPIFSKVLKRRRRRVSTSTEALEISL